LKTGCSCASILANNHRYNNPYGYTERRGQKTLAIPSRDLLIADHWNRRRSESGSQSDLPRGVKLAETPQFQADADAPTGQHSALPIPLTRRPKSELTPSQSKVGNRKSQ
jgi:hypothetical protein